MPGNAGTCGAGTCILIVQPGLWWGSHSAGGTGFSLIAHSFPNIGNAAKFGGQTSRSARVLQDPLFAQRNQPYPSTNRPTWTSAVRAGVLPTTSPTPHWRKHGTPKSAYRGAAAKASSHSEDRPRSCRRPLDFVACPE